MSSATPRSTRLHITFGLLLPLTLLVFNMARVWSFTVDDAYISYRYARNFARGMGLVYNAGEHVEGYTNFLWTVMLGVGLRLHVDPDVLAKIVGALAACGSLCVVYLLSKRLRPFNGVPCLATWLMATSIVQTGYAVFGLETALFVFLILSGVEMLLSERDRGTGFPYSGLVFGLAGLTRPEAPMFVAIAMVFLGWRLVGRQNVLRGMLFAGTMLAHALWRHSYYGTWLPNTALAKTGTLGQQLRRGEHYAWEYAKDSWLVLALVCVGVFIALLPLVRFWRGRLALRDVARHADALCIAALAGTSACYVVVIGADWMPFFRFFAPFEPFAFVLACFGVRSVASAVASLIAAPGRTAAMRTAMTAGCIVAFVVALGAFRADHLIAAQRFFISNEKVFWDSAAGESAWWLLSERPPGRIAVWDIGYIGYATDYPLLDLFGLVEPTIAKLPGGYTRRTSPAYLDRIFKKNPDYFVLVGRPETCDIVSPPEERLRSDARFQSSYRLAERIRHVRQGYWCIFERKPPQVSSMGKADTAGLR